MSVHCSRNTSFDHGYVTLWTSAAGVRSEKSTHFPTNSFYIAHASPGSRPRRGGDEVQVNVQS